MEEDETGDYVRFIDANSKINTLEKQLKLVHAEMMKLSLENDSLERQLDPQSFFEGWDE